MRQGWRRLPRAALAAAPEPVEIFPRAKQPTKSLRQVAVTPPYMHTGQMPTLMDVINFYDRGGDEVGDFLGVKDENIRPLNLSEQEKLDLIEFLKTLTGEPLPPSLMQDTSNR